MTLFRPRQIKMSACLFCLTVSPALCQSGSSPVNWGLNNNQIRSSALINNFSKPQALKDQPELPQLPEYSGKYKFQTGFVRSNPEGWTVYSLSLLTQENASEVMTWYQNTFNMYQWKNLRLTPVSVSAEQKNGDTCFITVNAIKEPLYRSKLKVCFTVAPAGLIQAKSQ
jgi:hypothetical protein